MIFVAMSKELEADFFSAFVAAKDTYSKVLLVKSCLKFLGFYLVFLSE